MNSAWQQAGHAWIFDLDGTLTIAQHDFDAMRTVLGVPPGALILEFIATQSDARQRQLHAQLDDIEIALANKARAAPGALALLDGLQRSGCPIGILTRNSLRNARAALRSIGALAMFDDDHILGRDEVTPKPDPAGIHQLLSAWQCSPADATMVGDYRFDMAAGRNAGCYTVHVSAGRPERWPDITDLHLPNLLALGKLVLPEQ